MPAAIPCCRCNVFTEPLPSNDSGYTHTRHTYWWDGFLKHAVKFGSSAMLYSYMPSFIKTGADIQTFIRGIHYRDIHTDSKVLSQVHFYFFKVRKVVWFFFSKERMYDKYERRFMRSLCFPFLCLHNFQKSCKITLLCVCGFPQSLLGNGPFLVIIIIII
jgi:hypothetical protein